MPLKPKVIGKAARRTKKRARRLLNLVPSSGERREAEYEQSDRDDDRERNEAERGEIALYGDRQVEAERDLEDFPSRVQPGEVRPHMLPPPLPKRRPRRAVGTILSFLLFVLGPTAIAVWYYGFFASNQYVAEFRFTVRDMSSGGTSTTAVSGLASMLGMTSNSGAGQNYMVTEYIVSREAVEEVEKRLSIREKFSDPEIDWWARFDNSKPMEKFIGYWQKMVRATYDQVTGISTVEVRAFTATDAYLIASLLVEMSERLVNYVSTRPQRDALEFAKQEVQRSEQRMRQMSADLAKYRTSEGAIDPQQSLVPSNIALAQNLRTNILQLQTELSTLRMQKLNPNAPAVMTLQSRISAAEAQLASVEAQIAKQHGRKALADVVGRFEEIQLEYKFAQNMLENAMKNLELARINASTQHLYITPFVRPVIPESSTYPNRVSSIALVAFIALVLWTFGLLFTRSIREHIG